MPSIRRRAAAVLAVLLLTSAGGRVWSARSLDASAALAQAPQTPAPQTPAPQTPAPNPAPQTPAPQTPPPPPAGAQPPEQPIFRTGINFVRVDVIVTDRNGNPVVDLTQDDFEVVEDDKRQTVETFRLV